MKEISFYTLKNFSFQLKLREWTEPLTMGNQKSEMRDKYAGKPGLPYETCFRAGPQPFNLSEHHVSGPSQKMVASTRNDAMSGLPFFIRDKSVLKRNDIYMSTSQKDFRSYKK